MHHKLQDVAVLYYEKIAIFKLSTGHLDYQMRLLKVKDIEKSVIVHYPVLKGYVDNKLVSLQMGDPEGLSLFMDKLLKFKNILM